MSFFHESIRVEFADTDAAGIVHFSNYLRYMERVEHAFWRSAGLCVVTPDAGEHISFPRVKVDCEYRSPARFGDLIDGRLAVEKLGGKSVTFRLEFHSGETLLARGHMVAACCRLAADGSMRSIEIPAFIREPLSRFVEPAGHRT